MEIVLLEDSSETAGLTLTENGDFSFPEPVEEGTRIAIQINNSPEAQVCEVSYGNNFTLSESFNGFELFCSSHPEFTLMSSLVTEAEIALEPRSGSINSYWSRSFVIGSTLYTLDKETKNMWAFDVSLDSDWTAVAAFPGSEGVGMVSSTNAYGYVSENGTNKLWEYDPIENSWEQMEDMPFSPLSNEWVAYNDMYYTPHTDALYVFDPIEKQFSQAQSFGSVAVAPSPVVIQGDTMYWYNANSDTYSSFNLISMTLGLHDFPEGLRIRSFVVENIAVLDDQVFIYHGDFWLLDTMQTEWNRLVGVSDGIPYDWYGNYVIDGSIYYLDGRRLYKLNLEYN